MSRLLYRLGGFCVRRRRFVLLAWILIAMGITAIGGSLGGKSSESFSMPGVEAQKGADLLMDRFSARSATVQAVVGAPDGASLEGRADELDAYAGAIEKVEGV